MKTALSFLLCLLAMPGLAIASEPSGNPDFSGRYKVVSCSPECSKILLDLGGGYLRSFGPVKILSISVIDQFPENPSTCDGEKPFVFNITLLTPDRERDLPVRVNNLENDPANWRKICDGSFATTPEKAMLHSGRARITLLRWGLDRYSLSWEDSRYQLAGTFELRKVSDRP